MGSLKKFFGIKMVAVKCGHKTKIKDVVESFGEKIKTEIKLKKGGIVDYCHKCLEKMAIQCAWCGKPIFIGDYVTLYSPVDKSKLSEYAVIFNNELMQVVGCARETCADTGADYAGIWVSWEDGTGKVNRFPSLIEMALNGSINGKDNAIIAEF